MSWLEVKPMDAKVFFISDCLRNNGSFSELCRKHGISRKTGYKWFRRYQAKGFDGLQEQSRRPQNSPNRIPYVIRKEIIKLRKKHKRWGAKKIHQMLVEQYPEWDIPSQTSIYNILKSNGAIQSRKRKRRVVRTVRPLSAAHQPNELWTADFKGQFRTCDGIWCYPLTVMDYSSRYLLCCDAVVDTGYKEAKRVFEQIFKKYGLPQRIRTDNGVPFASTSVGGLSRLSVWWVELGIIPERIMPGKPQQNGRHERMHRTLKDETACPPASTVKEQQKRFDKFRRTYNQIRPHEGIEMEVPQKIYEKSDRQISDILSEIVYPGYFKIVLVNHNGCVWVNGQSVYLGYLLKGQNIGLEETESEVWDVYFGPIPLGQIKKTEKDLLEFTKESKKCYLCL